MLSFQFLQARHNIWNTLVFIFKYVTAKSFAENLIMTVPQRSRWQWLVRKTSSQPLSWSIKIHTENHFVFKERRNEVNWGSSSCWYRLKDKFTASLSDGDTGPNYQISKFSNSLQWNRFDNLETKSGRRERIKKLQCQQTVIKVAICLHWHQVQSLVCWTTEMSSCTYNSASIEM